MRSDYRSAAVVVSLKRLRYTQMRSHRLQTPRVYSAGVLHTGRIRVLGMHFMIRAVAALRSF